MNHVFHDKPSFINHEELNEPLEVRISDFRCFLIGTGSLSRTLWDTIGK